MAWQPEAQVMYSPVSFWDCSRSVPTSFESAVAAVTLHGLAGATAASSRSSYSMIASDIAEQVGTVLLNAENQTNLFLLS